MAEDYGYEANGDIYYKNEGMYCCGKDDECEYKTKVTSTADGTYVGIEYIICDDSSNDSKTQQVYTKANKLNLQERAYGKITHELSLIGNQLAWIGICMLVITICQIMQCVKW